MQGDVMLSTLFKSKKRFFKIVRSLFFSILMLLPFQNCSQGGLLKSNGDFSPTSDAQTASNETSCSFNNTSMAEGQSVTAYLTAAVDSNHQCEKEVRTCNNGTLSGSFSYASCKIEPLKFDENHCPIANEVLIYSASDMITYLKACEQKAKLYIVMNDIDFMNQEIQASPLNNSIFDGQNHTIKNFKLYSPLAKNFEYNGLGLFSFVKSSIILNTHISNFSLNNQGQAYAGGLVGRCWSSYLKNVSANNGEINSKALFATGGLLGEAYGCYIAEASSENVKLSVETNNNYNYGGLAGRNPNGQSFVIISNSYTLNTGNISIKLGEQPLSLLNLRGSSGGGTVYYLFNSYDINETPYNQNSQSLWNFQTIWKLESSDRPTLRHDLVERQKLMLARFVSNEPINPISNTKAIHLNECQKTTLQLVDVYNSRRNSTKALEFSVQSSGLTAYENLADCESTTNALNLVTLDSGQTEKNFFLKAQSSKLQDLQMVHIFPFNENLLTENLFLRYEQAPKP